MVFEQFSNIFSSISELYSIAIAKPRYNASGICKVTVSAILLAVSKQEKIILKSEIRLKS